MSKTTNLVELSIPPPNLPNVERFLRAADALTIESGQDSKDAQEIRASINTQIKDLNDQRMEITRPMDAAKAKIVALFAAPIATLSRALGIFDGKIIEWDNEQERIAAEQQRKLDAQAAAERERLQKIADAAAAKGQHGKAEQFQERAQAVVPQVVQPEAPRAAGVAMPKRWVYKITDARKINAAFLCPDDTKIGKTVRAMGADAAQLIGEGIEIWQEKTLASRRS
jgi:hypothetical protein